MTKGRTARHPNHGDWFIEDQTRTDNGFALMRYCAVLPFIGWQHFGNFGSVEDAVVAKHDRLDIQFDGSPWPTKEEA